MSSYDTEKAFGSFRPEGFFLRCICLSRGIDGTIPGRLGRLHQGLGKGRVTVDRPGDVFRTGAEFNGQDAFGNHVCGPGAENMDAQDPVRPGVADHFDEPVGFAHAPGPAGA